MKHYINNLNKHMSFQFWNLWGTIIALATYGDKKFYASGKTKDEVIAKVYELATN